MKNSLLILTSYPEQGTVHSAKTVGVASYTKLILMELKRLYPGTRLTVLAERFKNKDVYEENGIRVERRWKRNSLLSLLSLARSLFAREEQTLLLSFEAYMFGSPLKTGIMLLSLLFVRLSGKRVIILLHQVPTDFRSFEHNKKKASLLGLVSRGLYALITLASSTVIVFEQELKNVLGKNNPNIKVIPHVVPKIKTVSKTRARIQLKLPQKEFVVLYFGFISPYKGLDWLFANWPDQKGISLLVAGGPNPNHQKNTAYMDFYARLKRQMKKKDIRHSGFVPEEQVPLYFSAADAVILPYKTFMSSSGPLSLAFATELPVLLSEELQAYGNSPDIRAALKEAQLKLEQISFKRSAESLADRLSYLMLHTSQVKRFSEIMKQVRSLDHVTGKIAKEVLA